jgi:hypothetical protein
MRVSDFYFDYFAAQQQQQGFPQAENDLELSANIIED